MPDELPAGLSDQFSADIAKRAQWSAFLGRNRLANVDFGEVVAELREFLDRPMAAARDRLRATEH